MDSKVLIDKALNSEFLSASEGQYLFENLFPQVRNMDCRDRLDKVIGFQNMNQRIRGFRNGIFPIHII